MAKSKGYRPTGALTQDQFEHIWENLPMKRKEEIRARAVEWDITLKDVLNRWPALRRA